MEAGSWEAVLASALRPAALGVAAAPRVALSRWTRWLHSRILPGVFSVGSLISTQKNPGPRRPIRPPRATLFRTDLYGFVVKGAALGISRGLNPGFTATSVTWGKFLNPLCSGFLFQLEMITVVAS